MEKVAGTLETIAARRSIRRYHAEPIPEADLEAILGAALAAPSSGNQRAWRFLVVEAAADRRRLLEASARDVVASCPTEVLARNGGA
ncbi:MAG: nitroreductase family protein, partial [Spirochaetaceae bacterium]|nr:nitroreductase family protein [Spirochaetaceae bacterium]